MRKLAPTAGAALAVLVTAVAVAQYTLPSVQMTGKVAPAQAGTPKRPARASLRFNVTVDKESRVTAREIVLLAPRHATLNLTRSRFCPAARIRARGVRSCPRDSQVGSGAATAVLGPSQSGQSFKIRIFAGSHRQVALFFEQDGGTATAAMRGVVSAAARPFGQRLTIAIPPGFREPSPGLFRSISGLSAKLAVVTTGCPRDRLHRLGVRLAFAQTTAEARAQSACR